MLSIRRMMVVVALTMTLSSSLMSTADAAAPEYYVSLGDSAAAGLQPPGVTGVGYADQLAVRLRTSHPRLRLVKLGCPGETSASLRSGLGSPCRFGAGSQLAQALQTLRARRGHVALITINVGVNDVLNVCLDERTLAVDPVCVRRELPAISTNLAAILSELRRTAPGVPIAGMTYWDPFLGLWINGPRGEASARTSNEAMRALNAELTATFHRAGVMVADVAGPRYFNVADFRKVFTVRGVLPRNVAKTCQWTWFCKASPIGPDPHPTTRGYGVIAEAFADIVA